MAEAMAPALEIDILVEDEGWDHALPEVISFAERILRHVAEAESAAGELSVLLTNAETMRTLNAQWRGKDYPTNVLSFPSPGGAPGIGDLALGLQVLQAEAQEQGKSLAQHFAHLLTHGFLHLRGYDHETDQEAERMEARERHLLAALGFADPYKESDTSPS